MYAPERQQLILERARGRGRVEVAVLAEELKVTSETVRRDLTALERRGFLRRVHGGALPVERIEMEPTLASRRQHFGERKRRIAHRAVEELPTDGTILLDSGTTTQAIADHFPRDRQLTVITNSIAIAATLSEIDTVALYVLGGRVRTRTGAAVGEWLLNALDDVCIDIAFLGTNGFTVARGMTTPDQVEAGAKRAMAAAARRVVVVTDSTKAGQEHFHRFAKLEDVDLLITDTNLDDETCEQLDATGMDVVRT
ncbi:MAG TPA: DeoR/GlpR family DNA-binding transcription regulator [Phycicoccus elongatus]|mgnify:CR=1 FL=1|nr:DeoR/GlpR transcriptional regulator [Tetrasphaera sp.]HOA66281.1 DeoR/GlpR family DNA-binding transcription regulator [Phycicoccus elongatus]